VLSFLGLSCYLTSSILWSVKMVKAGKKTTTTVTNIKEKDKENQQIYVLMRDIVTNAHHVIQRSKVITAKKIQKLEPGDEISFGQRGGRVRGILLMIGEIAYF
jgi:hypothetical protein